MKNGQVFKQALETTPHRRFLYFLTEHTVPWRHLSLLVCMLGPAMA